MTKHIITETSDQVAVLTLNRPEKLNAWHAPMRNEIIDALKSFESDSNVRAIIMTGSGDRAFGAGQDLEEARHFDVSRSESWMREWEAYYDQIRSLTKPFVMALNGVTAGSAFQVALLGDIRVAHSGVMLGQPEINSGIASVTGPWLMREMIGLSRTIELTLTGRMMDATEAHKIGLVHYLVPQEKVMEKSMEIARMLSEKAPVAMRLNKQRFKEVTELGFREAISAGIRNQAESYASGEPAAYMQKFFDSRRKR